MSMDATFPSSFTDSSHSLAAPMVCSVSLAGLQNPGISSFFSCHPCSEIFGALRVGYVGYAKWFFTSEVHRQKLRHGALKNAL